MHFDKHISQRGVVDNCKVTSYNMGSQIIYEWGTCTGAIRRLRFEIVNIEIMQHVFVNKKYVDAIGTALTDPQNMVEFYI